MSRFLNERYAGFSAYTPGEQPANKKYIKLNTNESPYPPGDKVLRALDRSVLGDLKLYPDPEQKYLRNALASSVSGVALTRENIFVSNGSDDILNFAFASFAGGSEKAVFPDISYGFYEVFAKFYGIRCERIPLKDDFTLCADDYMLGNRGLIVIANPNAPTGLTVSTGDIERIAEANPDSVVLVDEAYVDFGAESAVTAVRDHENLLVVRTYSKSYSLAGARLGWAIGSHSLISDLELMKYSTNPYSINRMTEAAGLAALEEKDYYRANCERIIATREKTKKELMALGFDVTKSEANFLFARSDHVRGAELYSDLKSRGILVRWFDNSRINDHVRITIGTPEDMDELITAVKDILNGGI